MRTRKRRRGRTQYYLNNDQDYTITQTNWQTYYTMQHHANISHDRLLDDSRDIRADHRMSYLTRSYKCNRTRRRKLSINYLKFNHRHNNHLPIVATVFAICTSFILLSHPSTIIQQVDCERQLPVTSFQQPPIPYPFYSQALPVNRVNNLPDIITQQGGIIQADRNITLSKQYNPIRITKDIIIKRGAKLTIEAGAELLFDKRKGIIVYGTLEISGAPNDRVKLNILKSRESATVNFRSQSNNIFNNKQQQVRLVDGDLPSEGRVQIKFNDKWHSLCTNSKNLTATDIRVICQQVGYQDGYWYKWFTRRNETTYQIMSKSFHCTGGETSITQCRRWNRVRAGGGVCEHHSDIGVRCTKTLAMESRSYDLWRGLEFSNSEFTYEYVLDGQMKQRVSRSSLKHVQIAECGLNEVGNATGAIRVYGQPPRMSDIEIKDSIYGIVIKDVDDAIRMNNVRLYNNMGFPLFINTSWGKISLNNMHVENNGGDGIRIARHERILVGSHDFCKFANLGPSQSFPVVLSHEQTFLTAGRDCCQEFLSNNQLTVHFPVLRSTPNNLLPDSDINRHVSVPKGANLGRDANLVIYDDYRDEFPFKLRIQNNTRAQSIVSKSGRLKICYEPASYRTVLFTIEVVANEDDEWSGIANDVEITDSFVKGNQGRGIWIENQRSGVRLVNTTVVNHNYIGGVHFDNGTGQVIIQGSKISDNIGHGVFINLGGGYYHIDNSTITDNTLKGVAIEYDKRPELVPFNHTVHVGYTLLARNGENGLFIGNVCRADAFWNVSMNSFIKNGEDAIYFQSCLPSPEIGLKFNNLTSRLNQSDPDMAFRAQHQDLHITHNVFIENLRRAIHMAPVYYLKSFIRHNLFKDHPLAVIYINSRVYDDDPLYESMMQSPVNIRIASNRFYANRGRYVANVGLQEDNPRHSIMFTKNFLEGNRISEPFADLKPRSRVSAVVVVSSSNTKVVRNRFINPDSAYDFGSHLEIHSKVINATANFWGHGLDAPSIYRRIFDRNNRYNLAQVEFLQYLKSPDDLEYATDLSFDRERDKISTFRNGTRLGGEVKGFEELPADTYTVQDDIYIRPRAHLIVRAGTVLRFQDGVGVMVQGRMDSVGQAHSQIVFTSAVASNRVPQRAQFTTTPAPVANPWVSYQPESQPFEADDYGQAESMRNSTQRRRVLSKRQTNAGSQNVRLSHTTMGRLEVQIDGVWGPVCDYNFDIDDAAVVCQQLGMILNKEDWLLEKFQYATNEQQQISLMSNNVLMTNLRCDPSLDTDVTGCKAEISTRGDFDGMCNSEVGIRCFPPSWSGIRFGMGAETSFLEHTTIQRAGMFDYSAYSLKPALQLDFNRHMISSITVKSNSDSGLGIMWNDVIGRHYSDLTFSDSKFLNNERHGIELRSRGLTFKSCSISNNRQNGLDYNPSYSQRELNELLSWLPTAKNMDNIVALSFPLQSKHFHVPSSEESYKFYIFQKNPQPDLVDTFTIGTDLGHMLSIHLLNPIHPDSTESLNMSTGINSDSPVWDLRVNMTSFPMVSPGYKFHFNYSTGKKPRGNMVLYVRSRYNNRDLKVLTKFIPAHLVMSKFELTSVNINAKLINSLVVINSNITKNGIGLKFRHPDFAHGTSASYNLRYANETTNITNNLFENNYYAPIFVGADDLEPNVEFVRKPTASSEITYNIVNTRMRRNKDCIRQFGRDIRYSHNVFHWTITDTVFESNRGGGINILLPYYWRYDTNMSHSLVIHNNSFLRNANFEFVVDGHFVALNVTRNTFRENKCRNKLISFSGMEKKMLIKHNVIEYNNCGRFVDFNIQSHADKMGSVTAQFEYNSIRFNRKSMNSSTYQAMQSTFKYPKLLGKLHPQASDYAMSLRGVQALNMSRNLFVNPELRFELVVAIIMDPNERSVSATENYWGTVLPSEINERIFDFDDWNSYAVAEISPYLTLDSFSAATMIATEPREFYYTNAIGVIGSSSQINRPLGGRLTKSMTLPFRREPYIVESDFTVMPNVRLIIEKGVTLEFMPDVGILILGELIAAGTRDKPIQMRPVLSAADILPIHPYLFPPKQKPYFTQSNLNDPLSHEHNYAFKHYQFAYPIDMGSIRLCKNEICNDGSHIYENNVEDQTLRQEVLENLNNTWRMDGFLEIFNMTTLQWVPVCDPLFTEHTARVACRQLGYTHLSLFKRGRRYTIEQEQITSVRHWPESVQCDGDESTMSNCPLAATGYTNHSTVCTREGNQFIYVFCSDFSEPNQSINQNHGLSSEHAHHWGGIRFSCPPATTGHNLYDNRDTHTTIMQLNNATISRLQYVTVEGAGMLHRHRSPAIQLLQCNVQLEYVAITNSAYHGLETIASYGYQNFHQLRIRNNLGIGFNYISLTGSSSASKLVPYLPLKHLDISSDIFGLVDICGANKEIQIEERLLIFYRYTSQPVDCVKIITSKLNVKHLGVRMLQFDLFNSTAYTTKPDYVKIYDGNIFDRDSRLLVELGVTERHRVERPELKFYQSSDSSMTLRLHVSGARPVHGFIAEVVTTPVSYNIQRDTYNNMTFSEITNNILGALSVSSAGESSPNMIIKHNRFESNCMYLFGNFTSCISPIYMELQNCQRLKLINNLIKNNQGGVTIKSYSHSAVSALEAAIENNIFEGNQNTNTLALLGPKTDPYQTVRVSQNFFTRNVARYLSNIVLSRIVSNFTGNIISSNVGKHQIEVVGFDKLPLSYQTFVNNWIYNNTATFERDTSTIFGNSAGQQYFNNYLVNPDNHFEISTMNWSRYDVKSFHVPKDDEIIHLTSGDGSTKDVFRKTADSIPISIIDKKTIDIYQATVNARHNWWGFNTTSSIRGRIRDRVQHEELIKVDFAPFLETNHTVLSGICAGGWQRVGDACLVYIGSRMTYNEAREFCDRERATLPLLQGNHYEFTDFIKSRERDLDPRVDRIWVRSFEVSRDACPALNDHRTKRYDCQDKYAFLCEKDPQIIVSLWHWHQETGGLIALILALVTLLLILFCTLCWVYKSRQRHKEKMERKNSIYASMRSKRNNSLSELFLHRQIYNADKSSITDVSLSTQLSQPINDASHLIRLDPGHANHLSTKPARTKGPAPAYANARPGPLYVPQPATNPSYVSPTPPIREKVKPPTPAPSYRESHSRSMSNVSSRTPSSYNGSHNGDVVTDPMPFPHLNSNNNLAQSRVPYTEIDHRSRPMMSPQQLDYDIPRQSYLPQQQYMPSYGFANNYNQQQSKQQQQEGTAIYSNGSPAMNGANQAINGNFFAPEVDDSISSVPTYYSNQVEAYEESSHSYLENYNTAYINTLTQMNPDQAQSQLITERSSSVTDLLINTSQLTYTSSSTADNQIDFVGMRPLALAEYVVTDNVGSHLGPNNGQGFIGTPTGSQYNNSTTGSRYLVETSFDSEQVQKEDEENEEEQRMKPKVTSYHLSQQLHQPMRPFGGSQRLSPILSSPYAKTDSNLGSRVYLETSFE